MRAFHGFPDRQGSVRGRATGRPGRVRRRTSRSHAPGIQLHGVRSGADRHIRRDRRPDVDRNQQRRRYRRPDRIRTNSVRDRSEMGRNAGAARSRLLPEREAARPEGVDGAGRVLVLRGADGSLAGDDLHRFYGRQRRAGVLHHRRHLRRDEPVGLYDEQGSVGLRFVPVHGAYRRHHRERRQYLHRKFGASVRDFGDRRARLRRAYGLRHAEHQE